MNALIALMLIVPASVGMNAKETATLESGGIVSKVTGQSSQKTIMAVGMVKASPDAVWRVLTDYDNYEKIFTGIKSHETISKQGNTVMNKVVVDSPWPLPDRWTLNKIVHSPDHRTIRFDKVDGEFKAFSGEWRLIPQDKGTLLVYKVQIDPGIPVVPSWLLNLGTKQILPGVIKAVRQHVR